MTRKELDWILSKVSDFMMLAKVDGKHRIFDVAAYSSSRNFKVAVRFLLENNYTDYIVLDYNEETELKQCLPKTIDDKSISLECDAQESKDDISYYMDSELTFKIHKHLSSYLENAETTRD